MLLSQKDTRAFAQTCRCDLNDQFNAILEPPKHTRLVAKGPRFIPMSFGDRRSLSGIALTPYIQIVLIHLSTAHPYSFALPVLANVIGPI
jgi:hypothetical protein